MCEWAEEHIVEVEAVGPTHDARSAEQRRDDEESRRQAKGREEKEMSLVSTFLSETELALTLVIAPEKLIDSVSTPGMDDTDWGTA